MSLHHTAEKTTTAIKLHNLQRHFLRVYIPLSLSLSLFISLAKQFISSITTKPLSKSSPKANALNFSFKERIFGRIQIHTKINNSNNETLGIFTETEHKHQYTRLYTKVQIFLYIIQYTRTYTQKLLIFCFGLPTIVA